ncbi:coatomer subunit delta-like [Octopus sinensis]|uniref:Coatomer subunit delta n=1 Tax=Octopus sinensis TaxID=2607531 RepID=A0A6P7U085_9MOLL|nr:coatomer subunit delta-like [Octopus sinensis]
MEGLLAAFPQLVKNSKDYTYEEIGEIRYIYQPIEELYVLLITNKASNIMEDIECLRLFARVVCECVLTVQLCEYCPEVTEETVYDQTFDLIFAFDEVVTQGYRENVTLSQVRKYIEMDSLDENLYNIEKQAKERKAKQTIRQEARRITQTKILEARMDQPEANPLAEAIKQKLWKHLTKNSKPREYPTVNHVIPEFRQKSNFVFIRRPVRSAPKPVPDSLKLGNTSKEAEFMAQLRTEGNPSSVKVTQCDCGEFFINRSRGCVEWRLSSLTPSQPTGMLEFTGEGSPKQFFPVNVSFESFSCLSGVGVECVVVGETQADFDFEESLNVKSYTIRST